MFVSSNDEKSDFIRSCSANIKAVIKVAPEVVVDVVSTGEKYKSGGFDVIDSQSSEGVFLRCE